jgi:single-stranded-DNA-specific exonuclease
MTGMTAATDRLTQAITGRERIAVHGDYDVDGVTSTVMLRRALEMLGADVTHFLPERLRDGYGLQPESIDRLHAAGARLIVSVDCGIRAAAAAERARALGVDLIITDHHEPEAVLPDALAVLNPKRHDCAYPDKHLAGVGVALKLVQSLCGRAGKDRWLPAFVKMAALGTLADVVPLVGENRVIAKLGLEGLSRGPNSVGLQALLDASGVGNRRLDSYHVAFQIAPRVNAAGRMSSPDIAARLLLAFDQSMESLARELAAQLNVENLRRQQEEADTVALARKEIDSDPDIGAHNLLVVGGEGWHRGVIGIVASKLVESYFKPSIVLSIDGELAHGSCRSIPGFDMLEALEGCADLFLKFGGHRQAAGLTMEAGRVRELRARLGAYANERLSPDDLCPRLRIDGPLPLSAIDGGVMEGLSQLAPFGTSNPRPVFWAPTVEICDGPHRIKDRHLRMTLRHGSRRFSAIAWRSVDREPVFTAHRAGADLAFSLDENTFQGETFLEVSVADVRPPGPAPASAAE